MGLRPPYSYSLGIVVLNESSIDPGPPAEAGVLGKNGTATVEHTEVVADVVLCDALAIPEPQRRQWGGQYDFFFKCCKY